MNGNWLGSYPDVSAKINGAFDVANNAGKKTALTLYYNPNNVDGPGEPTPVEFSQQYVPADMRAGLDYVWLSYYETDFNNYRPSAAVLTALFQQLHALYPNAVLGFGRSASTGPPRRRRFRRRGRSCRTTTGCRSRFRTTAVATSGGTEPKTCSEPTH